MSEADQTATFTFAKAIPPGAYRLAIDYAGRIGTGFTDATLAKLAGLLAPLERGASPFDVGQPPPRAHFVEPRLVGDFEFSEWTRAGQVRAAAYKGLREDRDPRTVTRERPES